MHMHLHVYLYIITPNPKPPPKLESSILDPETRAPGNNVVVEGRPITPETAIPNPESGDPKSNVGKTREFKLPWRKAGLSYHHDDEANADQ